MNEVSYTTHVSHIAVLTLTLAQPNIISLSIEEFSCSNPLDPVSVNINWEVNILCDQYTLYVDYIAHLSTGWRQTSGYNISTSYKCEC